MTETSEKPRILILTTAYLPLIGGSELAIKHLAQRLPGYDFDLVTGLYDPTMPVSEKIDDVQVFRAGGRLARISLLLPKILMPVAMALTTLRLMHRRKYGVIHAYQASQAAGAAWLVKRLYPRMPLLLTLQEGKELDKQSFLVRFFRSIIFRSVTRITAISEYLGSYARRYTRVPIDIVPNGVDTKTLVPVAHVPGHTVISVSRLVPKNGIEQLIRAMPFVQERYPDARLLLVGGGSLRDHLMRVSRELSVHADFLGPAPHDHLAGYLHRADIFVRPSLSEGFGSAFLEAMAVGLPVIGSPVGGIPDFLHHDQTGLICNPKEPADIARNIIRLFSDSALRERLATNALAMVRERYDWNTIAQQMDSVYKKFL